MHQVRSCLKRLLDEGVVEKAPRSRPVRYRSTASIGPLFDERGLTSGAEPDSTDRTASMAIVMQRRIDAGLDCIGALSFEMVPPPASG